MINWFTSDLHLSHKNIVRGVSTWPALSECRDFKTVDEMDNLIINNINSKVKENDTLYIGGDFSLSSLTKWPYYRYRINCKNIHLILGNHDPKRELRRGDKPLVGTIFPGDLFSTITDYKEVKLTDGTLVCISHYSMRSWNKCHHGSWMLFGHDHGMILDPENKKGEKLKSTDIGVDANNFFPISEDELREKFKNRPNNYIGHHQNRD